MIRELRSIDPHSFVRICTDSDACFGPSRVRVKWGGTQRLALLRLLSVLPCSSRWSSLTSGRLLIWHDAPLGASGANRLLPARPSLEAREAWTGGWDQASRERSEDFQSLTPWRVRRSLRRARPRRILRSIARHMGEHLKVYSSLSFLKECAIFDEGPGNPFPLGVGWLSRRRRRAIKAMPTKGREYRQSVPA